MASWIRPGAIVGAVALFLGVAAALFTSAFYCFDTCGPNLSRAIAANLVRCLGLALTGFAWILSLLERARGGQWRRFAVLLLALPATLVATEVALWIADGGIAGGWLLPQAEFDLETWKSWALLTLVCSC